MGEFNRPKSIRLPSDEELVRISVAWPGGGWTWDRRHACVVCSFSAASASEYESVLASVFPIRWNYKTITRAPATLQTLVAVTGGVRDGQLVYTPKALHDDFAYALWWPWGDDANVSARLALSESSERWLAALRERFGAEE